MKLRLSTELLPVVDVGMYCSHLSVDEIFGVCIYEIESSNILTPDEIDYALNAPFDIDKYENVVTKYAMEQLDDFFKDIAYWDNIHATLLPDGSIHSPSEYNFRTNELHFELDIHESEIRKIQSRTIGDKDFMKWIYDKYKSCSGFISFMPYREDEYVKAIHGKDLERAVAMYLAYLFRNNSNKDYYTESVIELVSSNHGYFDFVNDDRAHEIYAKVVDADNCAS